MENGVCWRFKDPKKKEEALFPDFFNVRAPRGNQGPISRIRLIGPMTPGLDAKGLCASRSAPCKALCATEQSLWVSAQGLCATEQSLWVTAQGLCGAEQSLWVTAQGLCATEQSLWVTAQNLCATERSLCINAQSLCAIFPSQLLTEPVISTHQPRWPEVFFERISLMTLIVCIVSVPTAMHAAHEVSFLLLQDVHGPEQSLGNQFVKVSFHCKDIVLAQFHGAYHQQGQNQEEIFASATALAKGCDAAKGEDAQREVPHIGIPEVHSVFEVAHDQVAAEDE